MILLPLNAPYSTYLHPHPGWDVPDTFQTHPLPLSGEGKEKSNQPENSSSSKRTVNRTPQLELLWEHFEYFWLGIVPKSQNCSDTLIKKK